uniref:Glycosyltransferases n=1 Tax=Anthurium amnicola TaxID=1678845 RepID=A0A1D1Y9S5_9ARAE
MKLSALQQHYNAVRRSNSLRGVAPAAPLDGGSVSTMENPSLLVKSPTAAFGLLIHALCCLVSLVLGFRFSRLVFFLLFSNPTSSPSSYPTPVVPRHTTTALSDPTPPLPPSSVLNQTVAAAATSTVVVGRHGILIRPWPHPNAEEVMRAHRILERVQREQLTQYGVKSPRPVIAVTPTYVRTFQALHLTGVMHSLMLVPYHLTWVVVEAGGALTNETASLLARSGLRTFHVPFHSAMPVEWAERHRMEARMRLHALRIIREERLDGIVVFTDDSNTHSMELFDEIQSVKWVGALSVGILAHSGNAESAATQAELNEASKENLPAPIQGPACNSSGALIGWHTFNTLPYSGNSAAYVGDPGTVLPMQMEWAGFVLNGRLLWKDAEDRPGWVRDLDSLAEEDMESPLALLKDTSFVEPLGNCGKKVMLWWLRVEARADSKFPPGWKINPPLEITVSAKRTPWPEAPPELPSEKMTLVDDHVVKHHSKSGRTSRSRHSSRGKRKRGVNANTQDAEFSRGHTQGE